jgi:putative ABC transport system permease protein
MKFLVLLAMKSLWNRRVTAILSCLSMAIGLTLLLGVERVRLGARESFSSTISQTDLIVGARTGTVSLLLSSVFQIGNASNHVSFTTFERFKKHPAVDWAVPMSMGDSHKGFRVIATSPEFFERYRHGRAKPLVFALGESWRAEMDVVLGSEVARSLNYPIGHSIVLAHGSGGVSFHEHGDQPFVVTGILEKTSTPMDRALFIRLEAMEHLHEGYGSVKRKVPTAPRAHAHGQARHHDHHDHHDHETDRHEISSVTVFLLGAKARPDTLMLQREINEYPGEPLTAILPALTLNELWTGVGFAENALRSIALMVVLATVVGLVIGVLGSMNERRREIAVLRSVGASGRTIVGLLVIETTLLSLVATLAALLLVFGLGPFAQGLAYERFGLQLPIVELRSADWTYLVALNLVSVAVGLMAGAKAVRQSLADGLQIRL